ncbi:hypothetical protein NE237_027654 [Protea cynaroides]|uniref:Uncharacterized protein n=1 Tax=Protea cynaroides TaxID=273540 RepID=A0A9Q0JTD5_9MAGN|nr:hypothetical protein NE237_027654 [Protea cynaroides]
MTQRTLQPLNMGLGLNSPGLQIQVATHEMHPEVDLHFLPYSSGTSLGQWGGKTHPVLASSIFSSSGEFHLLFKSLHVHSGQVLNLQSLVIDRSEEVLLILLKFLFVSPRVLVVILYPFLIVFLPPQSTDSLIVFDIFTKLASIFGEGIQDSALEFAELKFGFNVTTDQSGSDITEQKKTIKKAQASNTKEKAKAKYQG